MQGYSCRSPISSGDDLLGLLTVVSEEEGAWRLLHIATAAKLTHFANRDQTLGDWWYKFRAQADLQKPVPKLGNDQMSLMGIRIVFHSTLRVPAEDDKVYPPPAVCQGRLRQCRS